MNFLTKAIQATSLTCGEELQVCHVPSSCVLLCMSLHVLSQPLFMTLRVVLFAHGCDAGSLVSFNNSSEVFTLTVRHVRVHMARYASVYLHASLIHCSQLCLSAHLTQLTLESTRSRLYAGESKQDCRGTGTRKDQQVAAGHGQVLHQATRLVRCCTASPCWRCLIQDCHRFSTCRGSCTSTAAARRGKIQEARQGWCLRTGSEKSPAGGWWERGGDVRAWRKQKGTE